MSLEKEFNGHRWLTIEENSELAKNAVSDIPDPTVADAGKALIVGEDGKYELGEVGGGGGEVYIHITGYTEGTDRPIYTILQRDPKILDIVLEEGVFDFSTTVLMYRVAISTVIDHNIQVVNYDGTLITLNNCKPIETSAFSIMMDIDTGNYYIMQ